MIQQSIRTIKLKQNSYLNNKFKYLELDKIDLQIKC